MVVRILATALLCACISDPRGQCATDADCTGGAPGSFCAGGICQGPPRGSVDSFGTRTFARADTVRVVIRVERSHGAATARVIFGGGAIPALAAPGGTLAADVPLSLAPAGVEGAVPFSVELRDDLGHLAALPGSVQVDDRAPRISIDPASIPTSPVLRGATVSLRVSVDDFSSVTVAGATRSADGSFALPVDTRTAAPGATALDVAVVATDAVGNASTAHASIPLTRLKFVARHPTNGTVSSLVLSDNLIWGIVNYDEIWILRRSDGASLLRPATGGNTFPQLATDGTSLFFARSSDNQLCRMGADGLVQVCRTPGATLTSGPILQGSEPIVATTGSATFSSIFFGVLDDAYATKTVTNKLADFASNMPAIGPDGIVYSGAAQAVATAQLNAGNWTTGIATAESSHYYRGQPAFRGGGVVLLSTGPSGALDIFAFSNPLVSPASAPTTIQAAPVGVTLLSPTIADDGTALLATDDRHLVALPADKSLPPRWSILLTDQLAAPPTNGSGGVVYAGTVAGNILALSLADGSTLWKFSAGAPIHGPLAAGCDGILYAAIDGAVLALALDAPGLANSPWPMASHDVRGSGDARRPLRSATGACLE